MSHTETSAPDAILRKSSQEIEIDHLLAEEFSCDPTFVTRFIGRAGIDCPDFQVAAATPEPSLNGNGFGDLLVDGTAGNSKVALLIEDKITAGPAVTQAKRYAAYAAWMLDHGWTRVWTVLAAPSSYRGERSKFDASIDLEDVASILTSTDPVRLAYRRGIIERALTKKSSMGVSTPDLELHRMKSDYLTYVASRCAAKSLPVSLPALRESYFDGDSWIVPIRSVMLPDHVMLRHRLWTSAKAECGLVDLIVSPATREEQDRIMEQRPPHAAVDTYSKGKGVQISFSVPEMRQRAGFSSDVAEAALDAMERLIEWYREQIK